MKALSIKANQRGLASIVVVTILVVLLSLISIGFARLMSRAVNSSLNNQLSTSANYAAQSGINDVIGYLKAQTNPGGVSSTTCSGTGSILDKPSGGNSNPSGAAKINPQFSSDPNFKYTCVLINPNTSDLVYSQLPASQSQVSEINPSGTPGSFLISWQDDENGSNPRNSLNCASPQLYDEQTWSSKNCPPLLRVSLYPVASSGSVNQSDSRTFFLYPNNTGGNSLAYGSSDGTVAAVNCNTTTIGSFNGSLDEQCNEVITGLPATTTYYARFTPLYTSAIVRVKVNGTAAGQYLHFVGDQELIDVTAQAGTATKRLQARTPISSTTNDITPGEDALPEDGLRSAEAICKRLKVSTTVTIDGTFCAGQTNIVQPQPPTVTADSTAWQGGGYSQILLSGTVNPNNSNLAPSCSIYYGQNDDKDSNGVPINETKVPCDQDNSSGNLPSGGTSPVSVTATVPVPDTNNYYWSVCASNVAGISCAEGPGYQPPQPTGGGGGGGGGGGPVLYSFNWDGTSCGSAANNCYDWTGANLSSCHINIYGYVNPEPDRSGSADVGSNPDGYSAPIGDGEPSSADLNCGSNTLSLGESNPPPPPGSIQVVISPPSGNYWGLGQYWYTFGTTVPAAPNDCRDSLHNYIACFNFTANEGGNYSGPTDCNISTNGVIVDGTTNGPGGVRHWSSQGHWILYTIGWSYGDPFTNPSNPFPFPYTYLNNLQPTVGVTCWDKYDGISGSDSKNFQWNTCGNRGQSGVYETDVAGNNCS